MAAAAQASRTGGWSPRPSAPPPLPASLASLPRSGPAFLPPPPPPPPQTRSPAVPGVCGCLGPRAASAGPGAMELLQPDPAAPSPALSPAGARGAAERPSRLPGLRLGAQDLLGSPERAATFSPVATLTQTMHDLAGLGR